jgi:hypothetical protein
MNSARIIKVIQIQSMKKILLIALVCLVQMVAFAQLETNLNVHPNPPGTIIEWSTKKEVLTYIIINRTGAQFSVKVRAQIRTLDGTVVASTNLALAKAITIGDGTTVLSAAEVLPLEVMAFTGKYQASIRRSGMLPAGEYELCVQLVGPVDFLPLSQERCRIFRVAAFQLPIPIMPSNEMIMDLDKTKATITFRWTPVSPRPAEPVFYRVTVFEILENQTPMQALRSNQPVLAQEIMGTTQYIWQHQLAFMPCCEKSTDSISKDLINGVNAYGFVWTIQTFDYLKRPFGDGNINGDGISEPNVFFIDRRPAAQRRAGSPARILYKSTNRDN